MYSANTDTESFSEILASAYGPGPLIILKNILSQICSRTIFEMHTAPGAYSKHALGTVHPNRPNAPGAYLT